MCRSGRPHRAARASCRDADSASRSGSCLDSWLSSLGRQRLRVGARPLGTSATATRTLGSPSLGSPPRWLGSGGRSLAIKVRQAPSPASQFLYFARRDDSRGSVNVGRASTPAAGLQTRRRANTRLAAVCHRGAGCQRCQPPGRLPIGLPFAACRYVRQARRQTHLFGFFRFGSRSDASSRISILLSA